MSSPRSLLAPRAMPAELHGRCPNTGPRDWGRAPLLPSGRARLWCRGMGPTPALPAGAFFSCRRWRPVWDWRFLSESAPVGVSDAGSASTSLKLWLPWQCLSVEASIVTARARGGGTEVKRKSLQLVPVPVGSWHGAPPGRTRGPAWLGTPGQPRAPAQRPPAMCRCPARSRPPPELR